MKLIMTEGISACWCRGPDEGEEVQSAINSFKANRILEGCVKDKHLYYAAVHTKEQRGRWVWGTKYICIFAVGVSPYRNLVGVMAMQLTYKFLRIKIRQ